MPTTREIPKQGWSDFLNELSKRERERTVRVEVENRDLGDQEMTRRLPLLSLELEKGGSAAGAVGIAVGSPRGALQHWIGAPLRMYVEENAAGLIECLEIEDTGGGKTLIYFEAVPEIEAQIPAPS